MSELSDLQQQRDDLNARMAAVFKHKSEPDDDGNVYPDFTKATADEVGAELADMKGLAKSLAVSKWVQEKNDEVNALSEQIETLEAAQKAADDFAARSKQINRPAPPAEPGKGNGKGEEKSLGHRMLEAVLKSRPGSPVEIKGVGLREMRHASLKALFQTSAGYPPESTRTGIMTEAVTRPLQLLDILPTQQTGQPNILWMLETTRTHASAEVDEGAQKPESAFEWTEQTSPVREVADSVPATEIQLEDWPSAAAYLEGRLNFGVQQRLDQQCFVGDGVAPNLLGLTATAGIQTHAKGADPVPDAFYKAMTLIRVNGRAVPTHHIMHPTDWEGIRLLRTADGVYIWGSPSEQGVARLWGLPVVENETRAAGTGFVGSFVSAWVNLWERRGVLVERGTVGDQFRENRLTIRASGRWALTVHRPAAFCDVTGI